jgi:hypothetical protein
LVEVLFSPVPKTEGIALGVKGGRLVFALTAFQRVQKKPAGVSMRKYLDYHLRITSKTTPTLLDWQVEIRSWIGPMIADFLRKREFVIFFSVGYIRTAKENKTNTGRDLQIYKTSITYSHQGLFFITLLLLSKYNQVR